MRPSVRLFQAARSLPVQVASEVRQALNDGKPVVSLELTIITHGLPYPQNIDMARRVEAEIRTNGGVPATCAFVNGIPHVGLSDLQMQMLAEAPSPIKVSRRDIGFTMGGRQTGGTTIALTMILSHSAGIRVFATGGLGGVHKDGNITMDVSADLTELGRTPVTVVCAGPKSILDIGMTMEYLETQGVFVSTYNDNGRRNVQIPGFYTRESGIKSPYSFSTFGEMARAVHYHNDVMKLKSGIVACIPPPEEIALDSAWINAIVSDANETAKLAGICGKELTPFLLSHIAKATNNRSVTCNVDFVINNARKATILARELITLNNNQHAVEEQRSPTVIFQPPENVHSRSVETLVVGSLALDTISVLALGQKMGDSNIGSTKWSVGGVGNNVALACKLAGGSVKLVSPVGDDFAGKTLRERVEVDHSLCTMGGSTALYTSIHESDGSLIVASADMAIVEEDWSQHVISEIDKSAPKVVVLDCNLSSETMSKIVAHTGKRKSIRVVIEPTSVAKASRIGHLHSSVLGVFPNNRVRMITPTVAELGQIYETFSRRELFDDYDQWFPMLDSLGINAVFREKVAKTSILAPFLAQGILQQAFSLVPYFERIILKLGAQGILEVAISTDVEAYKSIPTTSAHRPACIVTSTGRKEDQRAMGVVIQYHPIPTENQSIAIKNVTGAGDTFLGTLVSSPVEWMLPEVDSVEQEWGKWLQIYRSQLASGLTLQCDSSVSCKIADLRLLDA